MRAIAFSFNQKRMPIPPDLFFIPAVGSDPVAYTRYMKPLAELGYPIVIVTMPFNLALFGQDAALSVIDKYPAAKHWVIGGHSLGGVVACRFIATHPGKIQGLLLFAAYCDTDLSKQTDLLARTLYASNDPLSSKDS